MAMLNNQMVNMMINHQLWQLDPSCSWSRASYELMFTPFSARKLAIFISMGWHPPPKIRVLPSGNLT
jgi:hypothetical protein